MSHLSRVSTETRTRATLLGGSPPTSSPSDDIDPLGARPSEEATPLRPKIPGRSLLPAFVRARGHRLPPRESGTPLEGRVERVLVVRQRQEAVAPSPLH